MIIQPYPASIIIAHQLTYSTVGIVTHLSANRCDNTVGRCGFDGLHRYTDIHEHRDRLPDTLSVRKDIEAQGKDLEDCARFIHRLAVHPADIRRYTKSAVLDRDEARLDRGDILHRLLRQIVQREKNRAREGNSLPKMPVLMLLR